MAREQKVMSPGNILTPAGVFKQKLARRTNGPESAKLSDRKGRAKVRKTYANRSIWVLEHGLKGYYFDPRWGFKAKVKAVINGHLGVRGNGSS